MIKLCESVKIVNQRGLHARASAKFVGVVSEMPEDIEVSVSKDGVQAEGRSILGLMMLGAARGDRVDICVSGPGAEAALDALVSLVRNGFGED